MRGRTRRPRAYPCSQCRRSKIRLGPQRVQACRRLVAGSKPRSVHVHGAWFRGNCAADPGADGKPRFSEAIPAMADAERVYGLGLSSAVRSPAT
jgi:hypothetical protein